MSVQARIRAGVSRVLGLGDVDAGAGNGFAWRCAAWLVIARLVLVTWVVLFPDSRGLDSLAAVSVSLPLAGYLPANDAHFYWIIARHGFLPGAGYEWSLVNFSPLFPAILHVLSPAFDLYSPLVVNTVLVVVTPLVAVPFFRGIITDPARVKIVTILVLFNPVFLVYSVFGLTEPLHFFLLFLALHLHQRTGWLARLGELACMVLLVLNRFIAVVVAVFYLYKAVFSRGVSLLHRVKVVIPAVALAATYIGWELACKALFGHTPSEARAEFWGHHFNFNPLDPAFVMQAPILAAGVVLGLLVLKSAFSRDSTAIDAEKDTCSRLDVQAVMALVPVTFLFLGAINSQISILRYLGTLFPLFMVQALAVPTTPRFKFAAFGTTWGIVVAHVVALPLVAVMAGPHLLTRDIDIILVSMLGISSVVLAIVAYKRPDKQDRPVLLLLLQLAIAVLLQPLAIYYP